MILETKKIRLFFWKCWGLVLALVFGLTGLFLSAGFFDLSTSLIFLAALMLFAFFFRFLIWEVSEIVNTQQEAIEKLMGLKLVLASLIDLKDSYTEGHSKNVRDFTFGFSGCLDLPKETREEIVIAAELHDIGKIGIPDAILKKPDNLKEEEYLAIQGHPQKGADSLKALKGFDSIRSIICHHHERFDGKGYPDKLAGNQIPLGARIIALADSYDAMLHGRSYRKAMSPKEALQEILSESGKQFDPELIPRFLDFVQQGAISGHLDPVCGMLVDPDSSQFISWHLNQKIRFCSKTCLQVFESTPEKYVSQIGQSPLSSFEGKSC